MLVLESFRSSSFISYEAHIGIDVAGARQLFSNYNCLGKPVKKTLTLEFDQSNPINNFAKEWLEPRLPRRTDGTAIFDLRQMAAINGLLFLGRTSIKTPPYDTPAREVDARRFWESVFQSRDWSRDGTLLREVSILKALAKSWFYVFLARRNSRSWKEQDIRKYIESTKFDVDWVKSVPGLSAHAPRLEPGSVKFSQAHNDIITCLVPHVLGT